MAAMTRQHFNSLADNLHDRRKDLPDEDRPAFDEAVRAVMMTCWEFNTGFDEIRFGNAVVFGRGSS